MEQSKKDNTSPTDLEESDPSSEFGTRYASDIQGVISLYGILLRGVIVNVILIVTNFVFLALYSLEVAFVTLCFLAMAVTSGPTELAGNAARSVRKQATEGLGMLGEGIRSFGTEGVEPGYDDGAWVTRQENICRKHEEEVLVPLRKNLRRQFFYTNAVDTFVNFFSSFLTVIVVITMTSQVYSGDMRSTDFLGVFYVCKFILMMVLQLMHDTLYSNIPFLLYIVTVKELQKPAMKISYVLKSLIKRSVNLESLDKTIFPATS